MVGDFAVTALEVPGHNPGCLCYLLTVGHRRILFSGDVIHPGGVIGLGNWPGNDLQTYRRSLKKLAGLTSTPCFPATCSGRSPAGSRTSTAPIRPSKGCGRRRISI